MRRSRQTLILQSAHIRHEVSLHGGEKKFVCKGSLASGAEWGCAQSFLRAYELSSHPISAAGSWCISPLREEAEIKRKQDEE